MNSVARAAFNVMGGWCHWAVKIEMTGFVAWRNEGVRHSRWLPWNCQQNARSVLVCHLALGKGGRKRKGRESERKGKGGKQGIRNEGEKIDSSE